MSCDVHCAFLKYILPKEKYRLPIVTHNTFCLHLGSPHCVYRKDSYNHPEFLVNLEASTCCRSTEVSVGVMPTVRVASMLFLVSARG